MKVADIMTKHVVWVRPETSLKDVAALLGKHGISGVPVVDNEGFVLGVVSEHDILAKEQGDRSRRRGLFGRLSAAEAAELREKLEARVAGDAMTAPAVTVYAHAPVAAAAALMLDDDVDRLPVLGRDDRLVGIVTRADLVRAFARPDEEIAREIREEVLRRSFWIPPETIDLTVEHGNVTMRGDVDSEVVAAWVEALVSRVLGVVSVEADLRPRAPAARA